jgi:G:T-mismatch repair DNA endonuclease (very short patch repair protein)
VGLDEYPNSPLETVIFEMIREFELPIPSLQVPIEDENGFIARPDFVYERERLIVEGHSKLWHTGVEIEASDRRKHSRLSALGYRVEYITWPDATIYREAVANRLLITLRERANTC